MEAVFVWTFDGVLSAVALTLAVVVLLVVVVKELWRGRKGRRRY